MQDLKRFSRDSQERQVSGAKCQTLVSRSLCFAFHQVPERLLGRYCVEHGTLTPELHKPTVKKYVSLLKKAWADKILCTSNGDMSWMGASSQMSSTGGTLRVTWALCLLQTHCQIAFSLPLRWSERLPCQGVISTGKKMPVPKARWCCCKRHVQRDPCLGHFFFRTVLGLLLWPSLTIFDQLLMFFKSALRRLYKKVTYSNIPASAQLNSAVGHLAETISRFPFWGLNRHRSQTQALADESLWARVAACICIDKTHLDIYIYIYIYNYIYTRSDMIGSIYDNICSTVRQSWIGCPWQVHDINWFNSFQLPKTNANRAPDFAVLPWQFPGLVSWGICSQYRVAKSIVQSPSWFDPVCMFSILYHNCSSRRNHRASDGSYSDAQQRPES